MYEKEAVKGKTGDTILTRLNSIISELGAINVDITFLGERLFPTKDGSGGADKGEPRASSKGFIPELNEKLDGIEAIISNIKTGLHTIEEHF